MNGIKDILTSPATIIKIVVAICYMGLGIFLFLHPEVVTFIDHQYRPYLAGLFLVYGAYRLYRSTSQV